MTTAASTIIASAEKLFFIDMLTRDIELLPAIADLVDNSVDSIRGSGNKNLAGFEINLTVGPDRFEIIDNAVGISADVARNYAFRFGRPAAFKGTPGSVGQFGIGMKRAIFKLGRHFKVASVYRSDKSCESSEFAVDEDIIAWAERPDDWTFQFSHLREKIDLDADTPTGTSIEVLGLHQSTRDDLGDSAVVDQLVLELATRHQQSISQGVLITVNGVRLMAHVPELQVGSEYTPLKKNFDVALPDGVVHVSIVAGTVAQLDRDSNDGRAQNFQSPSTAGWYIFCNDRLLLAADKSSITGWGSPAAAYHPQYRNFRGYVYMQADNAGLLPWNTTKTTVDRDHPVFRAVASEMKIALTQVQAIINRVKGETQRWNEQKAVLEEQGNPAPEPTPLMRAASASAAPVHSIPLSSAASAPPATRFPAPPKDEPDFHRIQYTVELDRYQRLSRVLGTGSGSELGRRTFEYVWKAEVD